MNMSFFRIKIRRYLTKFEPVDALVRFHPSYTSQFLIKKSCKVCDKDKLYVELGEKRKYGSDGFCTFVI
jgi:hypothetical protein